VEHPRPGSPEFFRSLWRVRPAIYRGLISSGELKQLGEGAPGRWCISPATARLFLHAHSNEKEGFRALRVPDVSAALRCYGLCRQTEARVTLVLNGIEKTDNQIRLLQASFGVPFEWRRDAAVVTLSSRNSGIGYHGGHEDGFIVQVKGSRSWKVWHSSELPLTARCAIFLRSSKAHRIARSLVAPLIDCRLNPGDALYIPPFFPHEGRTIRESLSFSIAWRGISPFEILLCVRPSLTMDDCNTIARNQSDYFSVLPDLVSSRKQLPALLDRLQTVFSTLGAAAPKADAIAKTTERLIRIMTTRYDDFPTTPDHT